MTNETLQKAWVLEREMGDLQNAFNDDPECVRISKKLVGEELFEQIKTIVRDRINSLLEEKQKEFDAL